MTNEQYRLLIKKLKTIDADEIHHKVDNGFGLLKFKLGKTEVRMQEVNKGKKLEIRLNVQGHVSSVTSLIKTTAFGSRFFSKNWWLFQLQLMRVEKHHLEAEAKRNQEIYEQGISRIDEILLKECPEVLEEQLLGE